MNEIVVPTKLIFHVFGAIAHFERRLIGERTKDGLAAAKAKAKGRKPGRPPVDPDKRDAALKLIEAGLSPTEAARQVGLGRATWMMAASACPTMPPSAPSAALPSAAAARSSRTCSTRCWRSGAGPDPPGATRFGWCSR